MEKRTGSYRNYGRANKSPQRLRTAMMKLQIDIARTLQNRPLERADRLQLSRAYAVINGLLNDKRPECHGYGCPYDGEEMTDPIQEGCKCDENSSYFVVSPDPAGGGSTG